MDGLKSRIQKTKKRNSKVEARAIEMIQSEQRKHTGKNDQSVSDLIIRLSKGKEEENGAEN